MAPAVQRLQKMSYCKIRGVSEAPSVVAGDLWRIVRCGEEGIVLEHATGDVVGELLHLFPNVSEEGVRGPAANENDGEGW